MTDNIYTRNGWKVCDNKIETVFRIKKELEPLYKKRIFEQLDQYGNKTLLDTQGYMKKGYVFWDVINRCILYGNEEKYKEDNDKKLNTPLNEMPYYDLQYVLQGFIDQNMNDPLNFEASIVLFENRGNIYVQFFGFERYADEYFASLVKDGILADWHYQNQTDDDDIPEDEEEERESMWDEIYPGGWEGDDTPAQAGLSHDFFSKIFSILHSYEENRKNVKSKDMGRPDV